MKITRRMVDPITFVERVSVERIPRLDDSLLDDQLGASMSYAPPNRSSSRRLQVGHKMLIADFRPPTPPKERGHANVPRSPSRSPMVRQQPMKVPGGAKKRTSITKPDVSQLVNLPQIGEDTPIDEGSMADLSLWPQSSHHSSRKSATAKKCVRFADEHVLNFISPMRNSVKAEIFWASDELANFRYEAFIEAAGLDFSEFD